MIPEQEDRLSLDAIKQIIRQSCLRVQQRENGLYNLDVLDAVHDLTGLPHSELAGIARGLLRQDGPGFFSVKTQIMMAAGYLLGLTTILFIAIRLFW